MLYDEAHIWGILVFRAFTALGIPCIPINSKKITQGALFRKPAYRCLVAPGGSARLKSLALGEKGHASIRQWLQSGGNYLGFCGGAGLALSGSGLSLGICPWRRQPLEGHRENALSGAIAAKLQNGKKVRLPVWWPGRFAPTGSPQEIVAAYEAMQNAQKDYPAGQPLIICGETGRGRYILSYAHLETPAWPEANSLLAELLRSRFNISAKNALVPDWDVFRPPAPPNTPLHMELAEAWRQFSGLVSKGKSLGLLRQRESWLCGWEPGIPGMVIAALLGMTHYLAENAPLTRANTAWLASRDLFGAQVAEFCARGSAWMEAWPEKKSDPEFSIQQKTRIFGHPMRGGGLAAPILTLLEKIELLHPDSD